MARRKTNKAHRDCYQEITNRILAALEKGTVPWHEEIILIDQEDL